jgi:hypothetical protein
VGGVTGSVMVKKGWFRTLEVAYNLVWPEHDSFTRRGENCRGSVDAEMSGGCEGGDEGDGAPGMQVK